MKYIESGIYKNMLKKLLYKDTSKKERYIIHTIFFIFYLLVLLIFIGLPIAFILEIIN